MVVEPSEPDIPSNSLDPKADGSPSVTRSSNAMADWWRLVRGGNVVLAGTASLVGLHLAGGSVLSMIGFWAALTPMLITASGNIDNDIVDDALDRRVHPDRPLATQRIRIPQARFIFMALTVCGLVCAVLSGLNALGMAICVVLLLRTYNRTLVRQPFIGNFAIALMGSLPILYGAICVLDLGSPVWSVPVWGALIALWLHLAREMIKDVLDLGGDAEFGRRTLPLVFSGNFVLRLSVIPLILAAICAAGLGFDPSMNPLYLFGVGITIVPALLLAALQCGFNPSDIVASRWTFGLKLIMLGGLAWMVIGRIT